MHDLPFILTMVSSMCSCVSTSSSPFFMKVRLTRLMIFLLTAYKQTCFVVAIYRLKLLHLCPKQHKECSGTPNVVSNDMGLVRLARGSVVLKI
jgi:hypothetical protein